MNSGEKTLLQRLRQARSDQLKHAVGLLSVAPERRCSRCNLAVEPADLSPGRYWCRPCESKRRLAYYHRSKRAAA